MTAKRDLETEADLTEVLEQFYTEVLRDEILLSYFEKLDLNSHLPKISAFWSGLLFNTGNYSGNMMESHQHVHARIPLSPLAFERWLQLFTLCIDKNYKGSKADEMKNRAQSIAGVLCFRITGQILNVGL
ncbi:MAG: group III truncated hemoglobin [Bacteroidia bacterium]